MSHRYRVCLTILMLLQAVVYGSMLLYTSGFPFVLDNNESFSALWHAHNLYHFGLTNGFGLTDEAYGSNPSAHPYVHTHQGNLPRLFAFTLYALGARSVESQILLTTFTIGTLSIFLAFHFLSRIANPILSLVVMIALLTDYIMYAQWHVNTYRVWHLFFLFASLLCVLSFSGRRRTMTSILTTLTYMGIFYSELIFAGFAALFSALYAAFALRRDVRALLMAWLSMGVGAMASLAILLIQLSLHLGWSVAIEDLYLTFFARNSNVPREALVDRLASFYDQHNIVFFMNVLDATPLRTWIGYIGNYMVYNLQVYTPFLTLAVLILSAGWLAGLMDVRFHRCLSGLSAQRLSTRVRILAVAVSVLGLVASGGLALFTIVRDDAILGLPPSGTWLDWSATGQIVALIVVAAVSLVLLLSFGVRSFSCWRALMTVALLAGIVSLVRSHGQFYYLTQRLLWLDALSTAMPLAINRAFLIGVTTLAAMLVLVGTRRVLGAAGPHLAAVVPFLALGSLAFTIMYWVSPGYIWSGYWARYAPFGVFLTNSLFGLAAYVLMVAATRSLRWTMGRGRRHWSLDMGPRVAVASISASLLVFVGIYWTHLQLTYLAILPPNHFAFFRGLREEPYLGKSFAVNSYAAPIAAFTGEWAYMDFFLGRGEVSLTDQGFTVAREPRSHIWLADNRTNPAYDKPDYFLCFRFQSMGTALGRVGGEGPRHDRCSDLPLVRQADQHDQPYLKHRVVERDASSFDEWVIVELDWDYPPFLLPVGGASNDTRVLATLRGADVAKELEIQYQFAQQDGKTESDSIFRTYGVGSAGETCLLAEVVGTPRVRLPESTAGRILVSVTPRTETKAGVEYFSDQVTVTDGRQLPSDPCGRSG
jgi:hypothetical protein